MKRISCVLLIVLISAVITTAQTKPADEGWPRRFAVGANSVAIYQPQIQEWSGNSLSARAALAITETQRKQQIYGVLWFSARAEIDKVNRLVTLSDFKVNKLSLPMAPDKAAAFEAALQERADKQVNVIAGSENYGREILVRCAGTAVDSEMEVGCEGDKEVYPQITPIIYNVGVICGWLAPS